MYISCLSLWLPHPKLASIHLSFSCSPLLPACPPTVADLRGDPASDSCTSAAAHQQLSEKAADCLSSSLFLILPLTTDSSEYTERVHLLLSDCGTNYLYLIIIGALNVNQCNTTQEETVQTSVSAPAPLQNVQKSLFILFERRNFTKSLSKWGWNTLVSFIMICDFIQLVIKVYSYELNSHHFTASR